MFFGKCTVLSNNCSRVWAQCGGNVWVAADVGGTYGSKCGGNVWVAATSAPFFYILAGWWGTRVGQGGLFLTLGGSQQASLSSGASNT